MGAMTMVFRVKDPAMLDEVKAGDNISFVAEQPDGQLTVARLEKQPSGGASIRMTGIPGSTA
jgi:Cu(I)/Ag(I) efflux system protein CusF